ncbi:hypothetical protein Nm8I071_51270 [Nonomuraea sp. TT08I-71]|nr:hypothetical protein Nm8I071_51270 [Nonomuraea sp. TT08I-71]
MLEAVGPERSTEEESLQQRGGSGHNRKEYDHLAPGVGGGRSPGARPRGTVRSPAGSGDVAGSQTTGRRAAPWEERTPCMS